MINKMTNSPLRKMVLVLVILLGLVLILAAWMPTGISGDGAAAAPDLPLESEWLLASINGEATLADAEVTAVFNEGQVAGSAGVNNYFASYEADGGKLDIGPAGSTMMMGPENLMNQEMAFLMALDQAESFEINGRTLTISTAAGELIFTAK